MEKTAALARTGNVFGCVWLMICKTSFISIETISFKFGMLIGLRGKVHKICVKVVKKPKTIMPICLTGRMSACLSVSLLFVCLSVCHHDDYRMFMHIHVIGCVKSV